MATTTTTNDYDDDDDDDDDAYYSYYLATSYTYVLLATYGVMLSTQCLL